VKSNTVGSRLSRATVAIRVLRTKTIGDEKMSTAPAPVRPAASSVELRRGTALERLDLNPERLRRALRCSKYELRTH
jgi:hypothetical protein